MSAQGHRRVLTDGLVAAGLLTLSIVSAVVLSSHGDAPRSADAFGFGLVVLACAPLAVRRRFPVPVCVVTSLAVAVYLLLGYPYTAIMAAVSIAVYTVCRRVATIPALVASAVVFALLVAHIFVNPAALPGLFGLLPSAAWIAIPATIGISRRLIMAARAREHAEAARRLREEERLRMAQEVHDVVGHGLAAIQMQADIAIHLAESRPEQGLTALRAISSASRSALAELREALRDSASSGDESGAPRSPAASLARLDDLCARIRAAGIDLTVVVTGPVRPLSAAADLAAYRIVQEALTNIVKYAPSPQASIALDYDASGLTMKVSSPYDNSPIIEGFGLGGIRRRAAHLGGAVTIRADDDFTVQAFLPDPE